MEDIRLIKEVFLSMLKWFLVILFITNIAWIILLYNIVNNSEISNVLTQEGFNNNQEVIR